MATQAVRHRHGRGGIGVRDGPDHDGTGRVVLARGRPHARGRGRSSVGGVRSGIGSVHLVHAHDRHRRWRGRSARVGAPPDHRGPRRRGLGRAGRGARSTRIADRRRRVAVGRTGTGRRGRSARWCRRRRHVVHRWSHPAGGRHRLGPTVVRRSAGCIHHAVGRAGHRHSGSARGDGVPVRSDARHPTGRV